MPKIELSNKSSIFYQHIDISNLIKNSLQIGISNSVRLTEEGEKKTRTDNCYVFCF